MCHPKKLPTWCWWYTGRQSSREPRMLFLIKIFIVRSQFVIDFLDWQSWNHCQNSQRWWCRWWCRWWFYRRSGSDRSWRRLICSGPARTRVSLSRDVFTSFFFSSRRCHWSFGALLFHLDFLTQLLKISPVTSDIRMLENQKKVMTLFIILPVPP